MDNWKTREKQSDLSICLYDTFPAHFEYKEAFNRGLAPNGLAPSHALVCLSSSPISLIHSSSMIKILPNTIRLIPILALQETFLERIEFSPLSAAPLSGAIKLSRLRQRSSCPIGLFPIQDVVLKSAISPFLTDCIYIRKRLLGEVSRKQKENLNWDRSRITNWE